MMATDEEPFLLHPLSLFFICAGCIGLLLLSSALCPLIALIVIILGALKLYYYSEGVRND